MFRAPAWPAMSFARRGLPSGAAACATAFLAGTAWAQPVTGTPVAAGADTPESASATAAATAEPAGTPAALQKPAPPLAPASISNLSATDTPNDAGDAIDLTWALPTATPVPISSFRVERAEAQDGPWIVVGQALATATSFRDKLKEASSTPMYYRVVSVSGSEETVSATAGPVAAVMSWYDTKKTPVALLLMIIGYFIWFFLKQAERGGEKMYVRRIPGIDAIEEAIGRATEMGRPVLYVPGIQDMTNIQTIASMLILGKVAETIAEYNARVIVPNMIPFVREVAADVVKQGYYNAGNPDDFDPDAIPYLSQEQFAFTAGVNGIMLRDKPAANIYFGSFFAESLMLAETGFAAKAIQVAGTAEVTQLPFFIAACDYTLIGEELFAASAYLSRDPKILSTLKAADWSKVVFVALIVAGAGAATLGLSGFVQWFAVSG